MLCDNRYYLLRKMKLFLLEIVLCSVFVSLTNALSSEEISELQDTCCSHGQTYAVRASTSEACAGVSPPEDIEEEQKDLCINAAKGCCEDQLTETELCQAGLKFASTKKCETPNTEIGKTCCEECSFGQWTGASQGKAACGGPAGEDVSPTTALRKNAYYNCCLKAAEKPETTTETRVVTTTEKKAQEKCKKDTCQHICEDEGGVIRCLCKEGFRLQADKKTCKDINECAEAKVDLCTVEDTVCHNIPGAFKCVPIKKRDVSLTCPPGFKRNVVNQVCDDINECQLPRPPCPKYLCENTIGGYKCAGKPGKPFEEAVPSAVTEVASTTSAPKNDICPPGFRAGPDDECIDIDECEERLDDCQRLSQHCINTHGSFFCQDHVSKRCAPGFKVNPGTGICEDIDECEESTEVCRRSEVCVNLPGAYNCKSKISTLPKLAKKKCQEGTRLRPGGTICEDIDECREGSHLCDQFQNCINTYGAHECRCKNGFDLDSSTGSCVDVDECALKLDNCAPGLHCLNVLGTFTCTHRAATTSTTTTTTTAEPLYEYEYYDSEENNSTSNVYPEPAPTTSSTTTTTRKPATRRTSTTTSTTTTTTTPTPTTTPEPTITPKPTTSTTTIKPRQFNSDRYYPSISRRPTYTPRYPDSRRPESVQPTSPDYTPSRPEYTPSRPEYSPNRPEYTPRPDTSRPEDTTQRRPVFYPRRPTSTTRRTESPTKPTEVTVPAPTDPVTIEKEKEDRGVFSINTDKIPKNRWTNVIGRDRPVVPEEGSLFDPNQVHCLNGYEKDAEGNCVDTDECQTSRHICSSLEICVNQPGGYICECVSGFHRDDEGWCVVTISSTSSTSTTSTTTSTTTKRTTPAVFSPGWSHNPSRSGARHPPISCELGFKYDGSQGKCVDINECATNQATCSPNEDCVNMEGGFRCVCGRRCRAENEKPTYSPPAPTLPTPTPPSRSNPEISNTNVITVGAQYGQRGAWSVRPTYSRLHDTGTIITSCPWGYKLTSDKQCYDIDECARNLSDCGPQQKCENFYGGYSCQCPPGHKLVGQNGCEDIDECMHGNPCSYNAQCVNAIGSYRCSCSEGFRNAPTNDKVCVDVDECSETPAVCAQGCANAWGGYRCYCNRGYRLNSDNRTCVDVNECEEWSTVRLRGKLCGGECINEPGSYRCACPSGYRLSEDQRSCIDIDECESGEATCARSPDLGTVCQNTRGSYHCHQIQCPSGYKLEGKHRCSRIQRSCQISDWTCLQLPSAYTYNFITFVANIYLPTGSVDLFTMHGPAWRDSVVSFEMRMIDVQARHNVRPADLRCFDMRPSGNICVISLLCSLGGPQVAELELTMSLYQRNQFAGSAVARLIVIVSEYEF